MKRLISFFIIVTTTFTISCSQTNQTDNTVNIDASGPAIQFAQLEHDYGTILQGADGNCEFVFTNTGTEPLTLSNVRSSCGCTVPNWPKEPIAPGQSSVIKVHYDSNRVGPISKTITVTSNGSETPIILKIKGTIEAKTANQPAAGK